MKLNARQQKFVAEYLKLNNATQAAIAAGYSKATAKQIGSRLLTNVAIAAAVETKRAKLAAKDEMDAVWVRERVKTIIEDNQSEQPMVALKGLELASRYNGMFQDGSAGASGQGLHITLDLGGTA